MKKALSYLAAIALGMSSMLSSCSDDYEQPPVYSPVSDLEANTTIADLKAAYWDAGSESYAKIVGNLNEVTGKLLDASKHVIVKGRVTTSDLPGNIYQSIVIEDETGAITVSTAATKLYQKYAMGQEALIDVTGLAIGKYRGLMQIGASNATGSETTRMTEEALVAHMQANGLPDSKAIPPTVVTIEELNAAKTSAEGLMYWQSRLITIEDVSFVEAGMPFADGTTTTNRYIVDSNKQRIYLRNSGRCDFSGDILPGGTGSVTAILSYYGTDWQLLLVSPAYLAGFEPVAEPEPLPEPNMTILQLKEKYWSTDRNYVNVIENLEGDTPAIIEGVVVSDDQSGNVYKNLVLRDETAALTIALNSSAIYKIFPYGQKVRVNVSDLKIGGYNGLMQIGEESTYNGAPSMTFMELGEFRTHSELEGEANPKGVVPVEVTIPELIAAKASTEGIQKWQSQLIILKGVHFQQAGQPFVEGSAATSRDLLDAAGNSVVVRTSAYASFKSNLLPVGTGDVTAILSWYGTDWQLLLNSSTDCANFDGVPVGGGNVTPTPSGETVYTSALGADFTFDNPSDIAVWKSNTYGLVGSGFLNSQANAAVGVAISPVVDLNGYTGASLDFEAAYNMYKLNNEMISVADYVAGGYSELVVREEGASDWTSLGQPTAPASFSWTYNPNGAVSLDAYAGKKIQFGFRYKSTADVAGTWEIKNITVSGTK